jgi:hypothetical protein
VPPPPEKRVTSQSDKDEGSGRKHGIGKVAWKQGKLMINGQLKPVWITVIKSPKNQGGVEKIYSFAPPEDAQILKRTPEETFYTKGKEHLPKNATVNIGTFDVKVMPDGTPRLRFRKIRV